MIFSNIAQRRVQGSRFKVQGSGFKVQGSKVIKRFLLKLISKLFYGELYINPELLTRNE
jgi:hypothetical protein